MEPANFPRWVAVLAAGVALQAAGDVRGAVKGPNFEREVLPIFQAACNRCHGPENPQGKLRLDSEAAALEGGVSGKAVVPGDSRKSLLVRRLIGSADGPRMPTGGEPLSRAQIRMIQAWIEQLPAQPELQTAHAPGGPPPQKVDFATSVLPIFAANCTRCHGPDVQQNQLRLDSLAGLARGSISGKVVAPGKSQESRLVRRLLGLEQPRMPFNSPPLPPEKIALVRAWIDEGAPELVSAGEAGKKHWAYVKPVRPEAPKVANAAWARNPIDDFILARLEKEGLSTSPEAGRETLIRRLSLDLIGLPPTVAEVDAFVADKSPDAYEKLVDRLLASPHYGERWARPWLDLARYADSNGYEKDNRRTIWKFRDWVIDALNLDMSFREFTIEQIAGDMLPNPTTGQLIATGFNRNTLLNQEGGVDHEEYRWYTLVDRVNTTATAWLGTTLACAQCHNHKFDPFTHKDYYRFLAFFEKSDYQILNLGQGEGYVLEPQLELPTPEQEAQSKKIKTEIAKLQDRLNTSTPELETAQAKWEAEIKRTASGWTALRPRHASSEGGATLTLLKDQSILASGKNPEADTYQIKARTPLARITGVRLEVLNDPSLPKGGPGRDMDGNFFLSAVELEAASAGKPEARQKITFKEAAADESQRGYDVKNLVSSGPGPKGWAIDPAEGNPAVVRQAVLIPDKPFGFPQGTLLTFRLKHEMRFASRNLGRFRLSVTSAADPKAIASVPARLRPALDLPAANLPAQAGRTAEQKNALAAVYRSLAPSLEHARDRIKELQKELDKLGIATTMIYRERPGFDRPSTYTHIRGSFLSKGEKVYADVPATLNALPEDQMPNRLGLATWLVSDDNPLTARVTVNRFWEQIFSRGLVETSEDFGTQGARPMHPELLDWLATEFMQRGWSMKKLIRLIVTSATYRQDSRVTPELLERDPYNKLLARGPRFRVEAEMVRDIALEASGLLSAKIGGPSVFPYQPEGVWDRPYSSDKWVTNEGEDRYRRGIYTMVRRTSPYPSLITFDAPSREMCTVRRVRTNTPLQALNTLNDPVFFEAAQALARRIVAEGGPAPAERVTYGFRRSLTRRPTPAEVDRLVDFYRHELDHFQNDPKAAQAVVKGSAAPASNVSELAAWTMVSNVLLNLDETITKE